MVLEKQVILVRRSADAPEDITPHEVVDVGTETVNNLGSKKESQLFSAPSSW